MTLRGRLLPARLARTTLRCAVVAALAAPAAGHADGGLVRARRDAGGLTVTLFTEPTPLRAGDADVSVLVQDAARTPLLDADVTVHLARADGGDVATVRLSHAAARNKLLQAGRLVVPEPGRFVIRAEVRRDGERAVVAAEFDVAPAAAPWHALWPELAVPPVAVVLFALHQTLRRRREDA